MAIAGYALLLAVRRGPAPAAEPVSLMPVPSIPEPRRLPHRPSFVPASAPVLHDAANADATLPIVVQDLPEQFVADAGVSVFDADRLIALHWLPLAGSPRRN